MDLALSTGYGPREICDVEGRSPLVRAEDVVIVGFRDAREQVRDGSQPLPAELLALDLAATRAIGACTAAERALGHLTRPGAPRRFWVHVDADVLDDAVMPAVDYRQAGGLSPDELTTILSAAMATGRVAGVEVTIYNPALDTVGQPAPSSLARSYGACEPGKPIRDRPRRVLQ